MSKEERRGCKKKEGGMRKREIEERETLERGGERRRGKGGRERETTNKYIGNKERNKEEK